MPSEVETAIEAFDRLLARREAQAIARLLAVWAQAWRGVRAESEALAARLLAGEANQGGLRTRREWADAYARIIEAEIRKLAALAEPATLALQQQAVGQALDDVGRLVDIVAGEEGAGVAAMLRRPSDAAVRAVLGVGREGAPLGRLFEAIGRDAAQRMVDALAAGVAQGLNPKVIARGLRREFGLPAYRSVLIARTESQRAYRAATLESYRANEDIIDGWVWVSACDARSCAACIAMHGTRHRLSETLEEHPGGRCKAAPVVLGRAPQVGSGEERFREFSEAQQRRTLGKGRYEEWRAGRLPLREMVTVRQSSTWGASVAVRPLGR